MDLKQSKTPKKSYEKPKLSVYGDLKTVTVTAFNTHHTSDNGSGKFHKTG